MTIVLVSQFHICLPWVNAQLAQCPNGVLNLKALVGAFNQQKALLRAFSIIVKVLPMFRLQLQWLSLKPLLLDSYSNRIYEYTGCLKKLSFCGKTATTTFNLQTHPKCKSWGCFGKFRIFPNRWAPRFSKLKKK